MKWRYSKDGQSKLFKDEEIEQVEKDGWRDSPAAFKELYIGNMNIKELRALAKEKGFVGYSNLSKDELLEKHKG